MLTYELDTVNKIKYNTQKVVSFQMSQFLAIDKTVSHVFDEIQRQRVPERSKIRG